MAIDTRVTLVRACRRPRAVAKSSVLAECESWAYALESGSSDHVETFDETAAIDPFAVAVCTDPWRSYTARQGDWFQGTVEEAA